MTIDSVLVPPVSHYLGGMIGAVLAAHSEIRFKGKVSEDTIARIDGARLNFLQHCEGLLNNPSEYVKQPDYQLLPQDRDFLQKVLGESRQIDWYNSQQVRGLMELVDSLCR